MRAQGERGDGLGEEEVFGADACDLVAAEALLDGAEERGFVVPDAVSAVGVEARVALRWHPVLLTEPDVLLHRRDERDGAPDALRAPDL